MHPRNIHMALNRASLYGGVIVSVLITLAFFYPNTVLAGNDWDNVLQRGVQCSGLPKELIMSVIWNESRGNPYAVNVNGVGSYYPSSPEQALRVAYKINRANIDVGLMQVNWLT